MTFEPELGQMAFGTAWSELECPEHLETAIIALGKRISELDPKEHPMGPASNSGERFENDTFVMRSYWWGDCQCGWDELEQPSFHLDTCWMQRRGREYDRLGEENTEKSTTSYQKQSRALEDWEKANGWDGRPGVAVFCDCGGDDRFVEWVDANKLGEEGHADDCPIVLPNFKYQDIEVRWYKWAGRGNSVNRPVTTDESRNLLVACLESIEGRRKAMA